MLGGMFTRLLAGFAWSKQYTLLFILCPLDWAEFGAIGADCRPLSWLALSV